MDRTEIYEYWTERNQSSDYADRLDELFNESAKLLATFPKIGTRTNYLNVFSKVVRDYKIFYRIEPHEIQILRVWDTRQHPDSQGISDSQNLAEFYFLLSSRLWFLVTF